MSSLLTEALSLCNLAAVGIFGIVLSAAFCEIEWPRCHKLLLVGCTILMLALQGVVSLRWGTGLARYLYPLITHLPLFLLLAVLSVVLGIDPPCAMAAGICTDGLPVLPAAALGRAAGHRAVPGGRHRTAGRHRADRHPADPSGADHYYFCVLSDTAL